jgi:phosphate-selective porin OprO/OprP
MKLSLSCHFISIFLLKLFDNNQEQNMKISKLTLAIATVLGAGATSGAFAMDLYVDTKTKQIYAEPGRGRELMGSFEKVDKAAKTVDREQKLDQAEIKAIREDLALKENSIKALQEHADADSAADSVNVKLDNKGLNFETKDKNFKFKLGGRIHADANYSGNDNFVARNPVTGLPNGTHHEANDGTEFRRARIDFNGTFYKDWSFKTVADFADDNVRMKDVFIQYSGLEYANIFAGQMKQNFSRELQESSNDMMFTERSLMNVLNAPVVDRAIGLNFESKAPKHWMAEAGIFGNSITPARTTGTEVANAGDEGWAVNGRATYAPIEEKGKVVHLGIAGNYRKPDDSGDVASSRALRFEYETNHMSNLLLLDKTAQDVDNIKMLGLEAAGLYGPFSAGAEYTRMWVDRKQKGTGVVAADGGSSNLELDGWYVDAGWTITGESRKYKAGRFFKVEPAKKFSLKNGGWGAWELATRYSAVDLNDGGFRGGEMSAVTVALNWYLNNNIRLMADYNRAFSMNNTAVVTPTGADPDNNDTFTVRAQLAY